MASEVGSPIPKPLWISDAEAARKQVWTVRYRFVKVRCRQTVCASEFVQSYAIFRLKRNFD